MLTHTEKEREIHNEDDEHRKPEGTLNLKWETKNSYKVNMTDFKPGLNFYGLKMLKRILTFLCFFSLCFGFLSVVYSTQHLMFVFLTCLKKKVFKIKAVHKELYWCSLDLEIRVL